MEWPRVIKDEDKRDGGERGSIEPAQEGLKMGGKERMEEKRKDKIPRSPKWTGMRGLFRGDGREYRDDI